MGDNGGWLNISRFRCRFRARSTHRKLRRLRIKSRTVWLQEKETPVNLRKTCVCARMYVFKDSRARSRVWSRKRMKPPLEEIFVSPGTHFLSSLFFISFFSSLYSQPTGFPRFQMHRLKMATGLSLHSFLF